MKCLKGEVYHAFKRKGKPEQGVNSEQIHGDPIRKFGMGIWSGHMD